MLEWLASSTGHILGITKTVYRARIGGWAHESGEHSQEAMNGYVEEQLQAEIVANDREGRYAKPGDNVCSPRVVLQRGSLFTGPNLKGVRAIERRAIANM